jgi:hypothetical protein
MPGGKECQDREESKGSGESAKHDQLYQHRHKAGLEEKLSK